MFKDFISDPEAGIEKMLYLIVALILLPIFLTILLGTFVNFATIFSGTAIGSFFSANGVLTLLIAIGVLLAIVSLFLTKKGSR